MTTTKGDNRLVARIIVFTLLFCGVGTLSGCRPPGASESGGTPEAFNIRLVRGVKWTSDTLRLDPRLPGYHLSGGIGVVELQIASEVSHDRLVLDITTSSGMKPNLESFTLGWGDTLLKVAPFGASSLADVIVKNANGRWKTIFQRDRQDYFEFQRRDSTVKVSFLPAALQFMKRECTITWIDWYRR